MEPAGTEALNSEQKVFHAQLTQAVGKLNEASDLVMRITESKRPLGKLLRFPL
jgi:hypothetical protein